MSNQETFKRLAIIIPINPFHVFSEYINNIVEYNKVLIFNLEQLITKEEQGLVKIGQELKKYQTLAERPIAILEETLEAYKLRCKGFTQDVCILCSSVEMIQSLDFQCIGSLMPTREYFFKLREALPSSSRTDDVKVFEEQIREISSSSMTIVNDSYQNKNEILSKIFFMIDVHLRTNSVSDVSGSGMQRE